ncbi:MAG: flagellar hook-length control protein FliK, partial [Methyloligellaceae bacterium]
VKPGPARPEFAPSGPKIIQRLVKPGSGQTLILFQERAGGEITGASSTPTLTVSVPAQVASPGPASANAPHVPVSTLAVHIAQQANNGARRFDIRLDPPELGRIEVRLEVSREGQVMTHLVVERSETLDLLQRDARQLERALQNAGLNTSDEGMKFSLKDQGLAQGGEQHGHAEDDSGAFTGDGGDDPGDTPPTPVQYIASTGLDIRI